VKVVSLAKKPSSTDEWYKTMVISFGRKITRSKGTTMKICPALEFS
jgi:endonuclease III